MAGSFPKIAAVEKFPSYDIFENWHEWLSIFPSTLCQFNLTKFKHTRESYHNWHTWSETWLKQTWNDYIHARGFHSSINTSIWIQLRAYYWQNDGQVLKHRSEKSLKISNKLQNFDNSFHIKGTISFNSSFVLQVLTLTTVDDRAEGQLAFWRVICTMYSRTLSHNVVTADIFTFVIRSLFQASNNLSHPPIRLIVKRTWKFRFISTHTYSTRRCIGTVMNS